VLRDDGTLWLNLGDSYTSGGRATRAPDAKHDGAREMKSRAATPDGLKPKDLVGIPWRVAFALQADGWYLRQDIIWHKPNPMPESVTDRCTKAHEYIFLMSKSARYFYDADAVKELSVTDDKRRPYGSPGAKMPDKRGIQGGGNPRVSTERKELRSNTESRHRSSIPGGAKSATGTRSNQEPPISLDNSHSTVQWGAFCGIPSCPYRALHPCWVPGRWRCT